MVQPVKTMLEKALLENEISRQEWETVLEYAARNGELVQEGEDSHLFLLVNLLERGEVKVVGVPHSEILRRLAVFI